MRVGCLSVYETVLKMIRVVVVVGLLSALPACVHETAAFDTKLVKEDLMNSVTFRDKLYDATSFGNHAWIVGYYGTILHLDGSQSRFERQQSGTNLPLFDVAFLDQNNGYVVGKRGIVLKTNNGGKTWVEVRAAGEHNLFSASFITVFEGWAVGDFATILHTSDGGITWEKQSVGDEDVNLNGCFFLTAAKGFVVGEFESIYMTEDGGNTWRSVGKSNFEGVSLFNVSFKNSKEGLAVGQNGVLFSTLDGGLTWKRTKLETDDNLLNLEAIGDSYTIVGLRGLMIEESLDGVLKVNRQLKISDWLNCIVSLSSGISIAAGDHGRIIWSDNSNSPKRWDVLN